MKPTTCSSCGAAIVFCKTTRGSTMPVDLEPSGRGNLRLHDDLVVALSRADLEQARHADEPLYVSHFATCPNGPEHRKRSRRR
jgi:hypothetical protein